jgi:hypothetical protein
MTLSEKNCLIALAEISLIRDSTEIEITEELILLASAHNKNQIEHIKSTLSLFKKDYELIESWSFYNGVFKIILSSNFPFPQTGSIDIDLLRIKHIRRLLLYKLYQEYKATSQRFTRYPLVELSKVIGVERDEIFDNVLLLEEEYYLKYGLADGGNCTSYLTNEGIKLCENKLLLFQEYCVLNLNINEEQESNYISDNIGFFNSTYVSNNRIDELLTIKNNNYDLSKLIKLLNELNDAAEKVNVFTIAMILRAIIDHIPPIFNKNTFSEVLNNYSWTKSNRELMERLELSFRKIADSYLHTVIRKKEIIPSPKQVDFRAELDVLLCEIISIIKINV